MIILLTKIKLKIFEKCSINQNYKKKCKINVIYLNLYANSCYFYNIK